MILDILSFAIESAHGDQVHVFFSRHRKLMLVFLGDIVKVDVCNGIVAAVGQMEEEVFGPIEVYPLFFIRIVSRNVIGRNHLGF